MSQKRMYLLLSAMIVTFGLAGCASNESEPESVAYDNLPPDRDEVICRRQRPVGSHVPVTVCRTRGQMERDREAAMRIYGPGAPEMGDLPRPPPRPTPP